MSTEIQNKVIDLIYDYEKLLKESHIIDYSYHTVFNDKLTSLFNLNKENNALSNIISAVNSKEEISKIKLLMKNIKEEYLTSLNAFLAYNRNAKLVYDKQKDLSNDDKNKLDKMYYEYIYNYHPALFIKLSQNDLKMYKQLNELYNDNNLPSFFAMLDLLKPNLKKFENTIENNEGLEKNFERLAIEIPNSIIKIKNRYPLIKNDVFENEMSILAEDAELRININKLTGINESLHKDLIKLFGEDFKLA